MKIFTKKLQQSLFLSIILFSGLVKAVSFSELQVGDIIFQKSQSTQSKALREATGSSWTHVGVIVKSSSNNQWYVAEAVGPVKATPISTFIAKGLNHEYKIYRWKYFDPKTMSSKLDAAIRRHNKPYDIYFEMSDDRTYCSELTFKAMMEVTGHSLGKVQKMKEMNLNGPYVKALIKKRFEDTGRPFDVEEPIITPVSQMIDPNLVLVKSSSSN